MLAKFFSVDAVDVLLVEETSFEALRRCIFWVDEC